MKSVLLPLAALFTGVALLLAGSGLLGTLLAVRGALEGFDDRTLDMMLGTYCPNVLFPYVRQAISDLITNGGFPPFYMQPINFEALYAEGLRRRAESQAGGSVAMSEGGNA